MGRGGHRNLNSTQSEREKARRVACRQIYVSQNDSRLLSTGQFCLLSSNPFVLSLRKPATWLCSKAPSILTKIDWVLANLHTRRMICAVPCSGLHLWRKRVSGDLSLGGSRFFNFRLSCTSLYIWRDQDLVKISVDRMRSETSPWIHSFKSLCPHLLSRLYITSWNFRVGIWVYGVECSSEDHVGLPEDTRSICKELVNIAQRWSPWIM